jgi:1,4-dihydroxy-2-naphthoate octaprenyltransferase
MSTSVKLKAWISAARLRTLPLSVSGILVGSAYAYYYQYHFYDINLQPGEFAIYKAVLQDKLFIVTALALITTLGFQVLSNFANDYGDGVKGTDNEDRIGPMRALQSGIITAPEMKRAVIITAILTIISAVFLIYSSLGLDSLLISLLFFLLGITAIWAAIKYTVGDNAYGYRGLGDVFVFVFFGPVSVMGVFYLITQHIVFTTILPAITVGLLSVAVLNLNNMRDIESDKKASKNTIVVKLGFTKAKIVHHFLVIIAFVAAVIFFIITSQGYFIIDNSQNSSFICFLPLLAFILLYRHLLVVQKTNLPILLDPELKKVALSTFFFAVLCLISVWWLT